MAKKNVRACVLGYANFALVVEKVLFWYFDVI